MRKSFAAVVFGLAAVVLIALPASAAGPIGLSVSGAGIPFVSGDVAEAEGAPGYKDAFDTGWGARLELYYDFTPSLRGQFGGTYQAWAGKEVNIFGLPVQFDDLKMWAIYVGGKYRFMPGSAFRPYIVADVGYASLDTVDIALTQDLVVGGQVFPAGTRVAFWDKTGTYFADAGLGFEFKVTPNLGIYLDARVQVFGEPEEALIADPPVSGDPGISVPISLGLNFNF
jgi:outer membrane protein W